MLRKRRTLEILSSYYCLPVQPTNAVLAEGLLLESKSREVSLDWGCVRTLNGRPLPIIHRDLLLLFIFSLPLSCCRLTHIFLELAGLLLCIRRVGFLPDCQTSTRRRFQRAPDKTRTLCKEAFTQASLFNPTLPIHSEKHQLNILTF